MTKTTIRKAREELRAHGVRIIKTDFDDYRVSIGNDEPSAYYSDDIDDALATGLAMSRHALDCLRAAAVQS